MRTVSKKFIMLRAEFSWKCSLYTWQNIIKIKTFSLLEVERNIENETSIVFFHSTIRQLIVVHDYKLFLFLLQKLDLEKKKSFPVFPCSSISILFSTGK